MDWASILDFVLAEAAHDHQEFDRSIEKRVVAVVKVVFISNHWFCKESGIKSDS